MTTKSKSNSKNVDDESETSFQNELILIEQRKAKALEKIANTLDALTIWFEQIDKEEWSQRIQYYLAEFHNKMGKDKDEKS